MCFTTAVLLTRIGEVKWETGQHLDLLCGVKGASLEQNHGFGFDPFIMHQLTWLYAVIVCSGIWKLRTCISAHSWSSAVMLKAAFTPTFPTTSAGIFSFWPSLLTGRGWCHSYACTLVIGPAAVSWAVHAQLSEGHCKQAGKCILLRKMHYIKNLPAHRIQQHNFSLAVYEDLKRHIVVPKCCLLLILFFSRNQQIQGCCGTLEIYFYFQNCSKEWKILKKTYTQMLT